MSDLQPEPQPQPARKHWTIAAAIVAIIGLLILTISGLCTGVMGFGMIATIITESGRLTTATLTGLLSALGTLALVGGIPMLIGFLLTRWGFQLRKKE